MNPWREKKITHTSLIILSPEILSSSTNVNLYFGTEGCMEVYMFITLNGAGSG